MTTILALMIITTSSGIEIEPRLMRSGECRITAMRVTTAKKNGAVTSFNEYMGNLIIAAYPIQSIECRAFRMGGGA